MNQNLQQHQDYIDYILEGRNIQRAADALRQFDHAINTNTNTNTNNRSNYAYLVGFAGNIAY